MLYPNKVSCGHSIVHESLPNVKEISDCSLLSDKKLCRNAIKPQAFCHNREKSLSFAEKALVAGAEGLEQSAKVLEFTLTAEYLELA